MWGWTCTVTTNITCSISNRCIGSRGSMVGECCRIGFFCSSSNCSQPPCNSWCRDEFESEHATRTQFSSCGVEKRHLLCLRWIHLWATVAADLVLHDQVAHGCE